MKTSNTYAESILLGSLLIAPEMLATVADKLQPRDFFDELNRKIYETFLKFDENGTPANVATIFQALNGSMLFNERGGIRYLSDLQSATPSPERAEYFAGLIIEASKARRLAAFSATIADRIDSAESLDAVIASIGDEYRQTFESTTATSETPLGAALSLALGEMMAASEGVAGFKTGFHAVDELTSGVRNGTLTIIAARPAMGKTAFALNIAADAAIRQNIPVFFFSLEMTSTELAMRILSQVANVNGENIRRGSMDESQWQRLINAAQRYEKAPLFIDDTPAQSIAEMKAKARRAKDKHDIRAIFVDYLQLLHSDSKRATNREQEIADISRGLKALAKELQIPVFALAQVNRALETRQNKRPILSDLRESGAIEQDADNIMFIHRPGYYDNGDQTKAEIIIAKQRNGSTGIANLFWNASQTQFQNDII